MFSFTHPTFEIFYEAFIYHEDDLLTIPSLIQESFKQIIVRVDMTPYNTVHSDVLGLLVGVCRSSATLVKTAKNSNKLQLNFSKNSISRPRYLRIPFGQNQIYFEVYEVHTFPAA